MRFKKIEPKEKWSAQKTNGQIEKTLCDIKDFNKRMNKIDSMIIELREEKKSIKRKIGRKTKYKIQLEKQLKDISGG